MLLKFYIDNSIKYLFYQLFNFLYFRLMFSLLLKANLRTYLNFSLTWYFKYYWTKYTLNDRGMNWGLWFFFFLVDIHLSIQSLTSIVIYPQKWFFKRFPCPPFSMFECYVLFSSVVVSNRNQLTEAGNKGLKWYFKV